MNSGNPSWDASIEVASLSDVGMRRTNNQDNLAISLSNSPESWQTKGHLFVVADGMGAHAAGELASKLAVDQIPHLYARSSEGSAPEALKKAVVDANADINRRGQMNEDFHNMGTTLSSLLLLPQGAVAAHIGDSRVYRLRQNKLEQLTFDHSLVWEMKAAGQLTEAEEAQGKIPKNVITRSLGPYPECKVDLEGPFPIAVGDSFLLCSDGLTGVVSDAEIAAFLSNMPPSEAVKVLVDLANLRGGPDNITVIIAKAAGPEIATSGSAKAIRVNSRKTDYAVHPLVWAFFGVSLLLTLFFLVTGQWMTAIFPGVIAAGTGLFALIRLLMGATSGETVAQGKAFGKGPYTRTTCGSGADVAKQLASILKQLQIGAVEQDWKVDWKQLKAMVADAELALKQGNASRAVRVYGGSISFLMDQLRNQHGESSSSVDL
ncbi:PP2C family protein-serine/threonine phosphatase [Mariniblastus fucicola]|uniref:PPM-type phosphatase domain-containing protein n=1 Tax=Mariniblastus fucicola TaxID=980251 RepID=A0A5B9PCL5_9BACT|nr:protein phosphatase 2C domain-containing protein [Mariniblastus fucicola]QEG24058.1 Putative protein phosphatase 2C-type [Mariniblastus fucicola]